MSHCQLHNSEKNRNKMVPDPFWNRGIFNAKMNSQLNPSSSSCPDSCFEPFIFDSFVSLSGTSSDQCPVHILRDTGGLQSVILANALPLCCLQGIEMGMPFYLCTKWFKIDVFPVAVFPALPFKGVTLLMGNDIADIGGFSPASQSSDEVNVLLLPMQKRGTNWHLK